MTSLTNAIGQHIADNIEQRIHSGDLQDGEWLQSERALSNELGVNLDSNGKPVEYGEDLYRGDKFRFTTSVAELALSYSRK